MYGNVLAMHYLKGFDMSLDLPEFEMNGPEVHGERKRGGRGDMQNGHRNVNVYQEEMYCL